MTRKCWRATSCASCSSTGTPRSLRAVRAKNFAMRDSFRPDCALLVTCQVFLVRRLPERRGTDAARGGLPVIFHGDAANFSTRNWITASSLGGRRRPAVYTAFSGNGSG